MTRIPPLTHSMRYTPPRAKVHCGVCPRTPMSKVIHAYNPFKDVIIANDNPKALIIVLQSGTGENYFSRIVANDNSKLCY